MVRHLAMPISNFGVNLKSVSAKRTQIHVAICRFFGCLCSRSFSILLRKVPLQIIILPLNAKILVVCCICNFVRVCKILGDLFELCVGPRFYCIMWHFEWILQPKIFETKKYFIIQNEHNTKLLVQNLEICIGLLNAPHKNVRSGKCVSLYSHFREYHHLPFERHNLC